MSEYILETPTAIKMKVDEDKLYTYAIIDFGVIAGPTNNQNFQHWMVHNVPGNSLSEGIENVEYLTPWGFERNADETDILDTGDAALHPLGILVFEQHPRVIIDEFKKARGCSFDGLLGEGRMGDISELMEHFSLGDRPVAGKLFWTKYGKVADEINCYIAACTGFAFPYPIAGRMGDISNLMSHFGLGDKPVAGKLFWTRRSPAADAVNCYVSKCTGFPFPYPIAGYNDMPECQP